MRGEQGIVFQGSDAPEEVFINQFNTLSQLLLTDLKQNAHTMSQGSHNYNQVFSNIRANFNKIINRCEQVQHSNKQLRQQLIRLDRHNRLLHKDQDLPKRLGQVSQKLTLFTPLPVKKTNSFLNKFTVTKGGLQHSSSKRRSKPVHNRSILNRQSQLASEFIQRNLSLFLAEDPEKECCLPKVLVMKVYRRWRQQRGEKFMVDVMIIKGQITNQMKRLFPYLDHTESNYRGVAFRKVVLGQLASTMDGFGRQSSKVNPKHSYSHLQGKSEVISHEDMTGLAINQFQISSEEEQQQR